MSGTGSCKGNWLGNELKPPYPILVCRFVQPSFNCQSNTGNMLNIRASLSHHFFLYAAYSPVASVNKEGDLL